MNGFLPSINTRDNPLMAGVWGHAFDTRILNLHHPGTRLLGKAQQVLDPAILPIVVEVDFFHALRVMTQTGHDGVETMDQTGVTAHALARRGRLLDLAAFFADATGDLAGLGDFEGFAGRADFWAVPDFTALAGLALPPDAGRPGVLPAGF